MNPATLAPASGDAWEQPLYEQFADELAGLTADMVIYRRALMASKDSYDFSGRASELLYPAFAYSKGLECQFIDKARFKILVNESRLFNTRHVAVAGLALVNEFLEDL